MTTAEKAHAYDEAIKRAKAYLTPDTPDRVDTVGVISTIFPELAESEDEKIRKGIIELVKQSSEILNKKNQERMLAWLERQAEQKPEENKGNVGGISPNWSEEDDMILSLIVNSLKFIRDTLSHDDKYTVDVGSFEGQIEWLQSLKDRVQPQPKQEWSEEDKYMYDILCGTIENTDINENTKYKLISWLKSLRPQNRWKPSEEQMEELEEVIESNCFHTLILQELLEQLKKLKKE
jgi:hypothetical protein